MTDRHTRLARLQDHWGEDRDEIIREAGTYAKSARARGFRPFLATRDGDLLNEIKD